MSKFNDYWIKLKSFIKECGRVLRVTKKPSMEEFKVVVKVSAIGLLIIGAVGFVISVTGRLMGI